jgi:hypothetical protein
MFLKVLSDLDGTFKKYFITQDLYGLDFLMDHLKGIQK